MSSADLEQLVEGAIRGDAEALQDLLQLHHRRLLGYVSHNLSDRLRKSVEPLDVVQDTYFEACRRIADFRPDGPDAVFRWLATIARHRILAIVKMQRAQKRGGGNRVSHEDQAGVVSLLEQLAVYRRTPSRSAAAHEFLAAVERSMERLPVDYRQVIQLRHIDGLDVAQTAARMSRTTGAISMLSSRALDAIRTDLRSASLFV